MPKARNDRGRARALDEELKEQIVRLRKEQPDLTVKRLLEELYRREILTPGAPPSIRVNLRVVFFFKLLSFSILYKE